MTKATGDDFSEPTKRKLAARVGYVCSNPQCGQPTSGPQDSAEGSVNVGEAAHISGARPGAARYDPEMPSRTRRSARNGIWLCHTCAALIDRNEDLYTTELLHGWKKQREGQAQTEIESGRQKQHKVAVAPGGIATVDQQGHNVLVQPTVRTHIEYLESCSGLERVEEDGTHRYLLRFGNPDGSPVGRAKAHVYFSHEVEEVTGSVGIIPSTDGSVAGAVMGSRIEYGTDSDQKGGWVEASALGPAAVVTTRSDTL